MYFYWELSSFFFVPISKFSFFYFLLLSSLLPTEPKTELSFEDVSQRRIPTRYRDGCVDLLAPLTDCRHTNFFLPWKCTKERHTYEKCLYEEFVRRRKRQIYKDIMEEQEKQEKQENWRLFWSSCFFGWENVSKGVRRFFLKKLRKKMKCVVWLTWFFQFSPSPSFSY